MEIAPPPGGPAPAQAPSRWRQLHPSTVLGLALVVVGAILLLAEIAHIDVGHYGWPLFLIAPGVLLLLLALAAPGFVGEGLAILGSIITVTGLILLYQNATDHFESWAYAWALVFPGSIGLGMMLYGWARGRGANARIGARLLAVGLVLFVLGFAFFEGVLGIGGYQLGRWAGTAAAVLIIAAGAVLLILSLTSRRARWP